MKSTSDFSCSVQELSSAEAVRHLSFSLISTLSCVSVNLTLLDSVESTEVTCKGLINMKTYFEGVNCYEINYVNL